MWANLIWCGKWKSCMMYHISNKIYDTLERSALKVHQRVFVSCSRATGCNFCRVLTFCSENFWETFLVERATQLWRLMRKTNSCKKTRESPDRFSSLIGQKKYFWPIRSRQFKHFWNWFNEINCPGARLDLTVNFHHEHFIDLTNCPWVSKDGDQYHVVIRHLLFSPSSVMILLTFLSCFLVFFPLLRTK